MLLPSALSCDSAPSSHSRLQSALFVSPPASPSTLSSQTAFGNIKTTCRSLQSLMSTPPASSAPPPSLTQLPTPPMSHAPPPMKLRLRAPPGRLEQGKGDDSLFARRRVVKRSAPPRGVNKRRRTDDDDVGREHLSHDEDDPDSDLDITEPRQPQPSDDQPAPPSTPKRARIAPEQIPLGLERSDFHHVHLLNNGGSAESNGKPGTDVQVEADGAEWSAEDDRVLVELVLDKLRLSKTEWQDCARSLGMDRHSVNRRWKSLMMKGDVGLKTRGGSRREKLHATWR
ncbi:hypothetical protein TOPH_06660 [Tolypocladium ophioglossoides CBS 100239]|uniref:Myb-like domain-containing protein n=1 Tax=Tolypocladium ophioglossoides (strain CBS 100239) TaxID=1163406 RepID=A0A0L0N499_TOLOC|nr:hypothetical protein TOPH_06660 [Tolypocladium ophioglossoides CBS 100239]